MNKRNSLRTNAILNGIKQCCGILFPLITFPYVSRVLGSTGFGEYSFSWSIVSYCILISSFGISTYAIREGAGIRDDKDALNKFCSQVFSINCVTTLFSMAILAILLAFSAKLRDYRLLIIILSTCLLLALFGKDWINNIFEDFYYITVRYCIIQLVAMVLLFSLVKGTDDVWKYCVIAVFASYGGNIPNLIYVRRYARVHFTFRMDFVKHIKPLLVFFVTNIAITVYVNSDITMLGYFYTDDIVGTYYLTSKIYSMIKQVINAVIIVALPRVSHILSRNRDEYDETVKTMFSYLVIFLLPIATGMFLFSMPLLNIAGGAQYFPGNAALRWLSAAMIFAVASSFIMNVVLFANGGEKHCLRATIISALVNISLNFLLLPRLGITGAAITTLIAEVVNCVILFSVSRNYVSVRFVDSHNFISSVIGCIAIVLLSLGLLHIFKNDTLAFIIAVPVAAVLYAGVLYALKNTYVREVLSSMKGFLKGGDSK